MAPISLVSEVLPLLVSEVLPPPALRLGRGRGRSSVRSATTIYNLPRGVVSGCRLAPGLFPALNPRFRLQNRRAAPISALGGARSMRSAAGKPYGYSIGSVS